MNLLNFKNINDLIVIQNRADQYRRCQIGNVIIDSLMPSQNIKGSFVLARFVNYNRSVDLYPEQVQFSKWCCML